MTERNGFTLIEMLAALLAGSIILVTLSWSVATLGKMLAASRQVDAREELANASIILTSLLSSARPDGGMEEGFDGRSDRLSAIISPPAAAAAAGPVRLELTVRRTPEGEQLTGRIMPLTASSAFPAAAREPQVILTNMRRVRFDYGDEVGDTGLPSLITLRFKDRQQRNFRIQVSPKVTTDGSCRFDPISQTCRP